MVVVDGLEVEVGTERVVEEVVGKEVEAQCTRADLAMETAVEPRVVEAMVEEERVR